MNHVIKYLKPTHFIFDKYLPFCTQRFQCHGLDFIWSDWAFTMDGLNRSDSSNQNEQETCDDIWTWNWIKWVTLAPVIWGQLITSWNLWGQLEQSISIIADNIVIVVPKRQPWLCSTFNLFLKVYDPGTDTVNWYHILLYRYDCQYDVSYLRYEVDG